MSVDVVLFGNTLSGSPPNQRLELKWSHNKVIREENGYGSVLLFFFRSKGTLQVSTAITTYCELHTHNAMLLLVASWLFNDATFFTGPHVLLNHYLDEGLQKGNA